MRLNCHAIFWDFLKEQNYSGGFPTASMGSQPGRDLCLMVLTGGLVLTMATTRARGNLCLPPRAANVSRFAMGNGTRHVGYHCQVYRPFAIAITIAIRDTCTSQLPRSSEMQHRPTIQVEGPNPEWPGKLRTNALRSVEICQAGDSSVTKINVFTKIKC